MGVRDQARGVPDARTPADAAQAPAQPAAAITRLHAMAGNRAVAALARKPSGASGADVAGATRVKVGDVVKGPIKDEVDAFLDRRTSQFTVTLSGTNIRVSIDRSVPWVKDYTERALSHAAIAAALRIMHGDVPLQKVKQAIEIVMRDDGAVLQLPDQKLAPTRKRHITQIRDEAMRRLEYNIHSAQKYVHMPWRLKRGEARMLHYAIETGYRSFATLEPHFDQEKLRKAGITLKSLKIMLDKHSEMMVEVAKRHPAARKWRAAFHNNTDLQWANRDVEIGDFGPIDKAEWARTLEALAISAREEMSRLFWKQIEEDKAHHRNETLRAHEVDPGIPAVFVAQNYDERKVDIQRFGWTVHGGMRLHNRKNEPIFLLRAGSDKVVYQNLKDKRFYEQNLDAFGEELMWGMYKEAGEKSKGAIALSKWVIGLAGFVFPVAKGVLMATDVLNGLNGIQKNWKELNRLWDAMKLAAGGIDPALPGLTDSIWGTAKSVDGALKAIKIFDFKHLPDAKTWFETALKTIMLVAAKRVHSSYVIDDAAGLLTRLGHHWETMWLRVRTMMIVGGVGAGTQGINYISALEETVKQLERSGLRDAGAWRREIEKMSPDERVRIAREVEDLAENAKQFFALVRKSISWSG